MKMRKVMRSELQCKIVCDVCDVMCVPFLFISFQFYFILSFCLFQKLNAKKNWTVFSFSRREHQNSKTYQNDQYFRLRHVPWRAWQALDSIHVCQHHRRHWSFEGCDVLWRMLDGRWRWLRRRQWAQVPDIWRRVEASKRMVGRLLPKVLYSIQALRVLQLHWWHCGLYLWRMYWIWRWKE